jgi:hypothetical protein
MGRGATLRNGRMLSNGAKPYRRSIRENLGYLLRRDSTPIECVVG